jgi:alanyl-tRNA synthetase
MLGNFSFGDYFKKEAIIWAWEFLTKRLRLPEDRFWISVHPSDEEASQIWQREIGISSSRIVPVEENFWEMGETGPCGACSEVIFDKGEERGCQKPTCNIECSCGRFLEIWNLVFMEKLRKANGQVENLLQKNIDTGMCLERLSSIVQGVDDNYQIDTIRPIILRLREMSKSKEEVAERIIADHLRAAVFSIGDGIYPSREGRGYVIRKVLRRAARFGIKIGLELPALYTLVEVICQTTRQAYPELEKMKKEISNIIREEEGRFKTLLLTSETVIREKLQALKAKGRKFLSGEELFKFYDTHGIPLDLVKELAREEGFKVREEEFYHFLELQKARSQKTFPRTGGKEKDFEKFPPTEFIRNKLSLNNSRVLFFQERGNNEIEIILDKTVFYGESGGQVGDKGWLRWSGGEIEVFDTKKYPNGVIVHYGKLIRGRLTPEMEINSEVDARRRNLVSANHTATHLLHSALRNLFGETIRQMGSLVEEHFLRFDFSSRALTEDELREVENWVNQKIQAGLPVERFTTSLEEARQQGALAFFGEKYGSRVDCVKIANVSLELCGGTHIENTSKIWLFKIISQSSLGAGLRRIEALTGKEAFTWLSRQASILKEVSVLLKAPPEETFEKIQDVLKEVKEQKKIHQRELEQYSFSEVEELLKNTRIIKGIKVISEFLPETETKKLSALSDALTERTEGVTILGSVREKRVLLVAKVHPQVNLSAAELLQKIARVCGGKAGGRKEFAQGGGGKPELLPKALEEAFSICEMAIKLW